MTNKIFFGKTLFPAVKMYESVNTCYYHIILHSFFAGTMLRSTVSSQEQC